MNRLIRGIPRCASLIVLLALGVSGCTVALGSEQTLIITTIVPLTGPDAAVGQAMVRAVDLAVREHTTLSSGYRLTSTHVDEARVDLRREVTAAVTSQSVVAIVGPFEGESAATLLPIIKPQGVAALSLGALPSEPALADPSTGSGAPAASGAGKAATVFHVGGSTGTAGRAAADLVVSPTAPQMLAAQSAFIVDDGTPSSQQLAGAFRGEFVAQRGAVFGQMSLAGGATRTAQAVVTAIIQAHPDLVFFAGNTAAGAALRSTLSLSGAPQLAVLTFGSIADNPTWSQTVGVTAAAADTWSILPAPDLRVGANAARFISAYHAAFPNQALLPQSALAYDAAMDEITATKSLIASGKSVTPSAVRAKVASTPYQGVSGTLAFDGNGDPHTPVGFSLYACDGHGVWQFAARLPS